MPTRWHLSRRQPPLYQLPPGWQTTPRVDDIYDPVLQATCKLHLQTSLPAREIARSVTRFLAWTSVLEAVSWGPRSASAHAQKRGTLTGSCGLHPQDQGTQVT